MAKSGWNRVACDCGGLKTAGARMCRDCYAKTPFQRGHKPCPSCDKPMNRQSIMCRPCFWSSEQGRAILAQQEATRQAKSDEEKQSINAKISASWTEERKQEWSEKVSGENNPQWKGGASLEDYAPGFNSKLKRQIRERDEFRCQLCGIHENQMDRKLDIHHIDYDKSNHRPDNLASTCRGCNSRVNTNESVWFSYFTALAEMRRQLGKDVSKFIRSKIITQHEGYVLTSHGGAPNLAGTVFEKAVAELSVRPVA